MSRSSHNLGFVKLRMPVPAILQPLILLQQPDNCQINSQRISLNLNLRSEKRVRGTYA